MRLSFVILRNVAVGATVNVVVAWGCAACMDLGTVEAETFRERIWTPEVRKHWTLHRWRRSGAMFLESFRDPDPYTAVEDTDPVAGDAAPSWTGLGRTSLASLTGLEMRWIDARGWPFLALKCEYALDRADRFVAVDGLALPSSPVPKGWGEDFPVVLPTRPIPAGFLVNTLLYSVLVTLILSSASQVRRVARRRRGECPECGYPRGAARTCSECGS